MAALLLEQRRSEPDPGERYPLLDQLRAELTQLRAEFAALRRDNLELRQQAVARRGRKRWLGLVFATQFPQHLPSELYTLCNNRVLLRLADEPTIKRLQNSIGGVPEGLWSCPKHLPPGQAIVSAYGIDPAMVVALEPGSYKLQMVD